MGQTSAYRVSSFILQLTISPASHILTVVKNSENLLNLFVKLKVMFESLGILITRNSHGMNVPLISPDFKYTNQYEDFSELLNEFDLTQIVTRPTRNENILDIFLIDNPTLGKSVEVIPGIADHDSVLSEVFKKPGDLEVETPTYVHV